jgi:cell division protein FtsI/penicillin-binding protein 2
VLPLAYKNAHRQHWQGGDTLNYAIGQGLLQVTPLQMASVISTVANGGSIWQPYLVADAYRFGETKEHLGGPHMENHIALQEESLKVMHQALTQVVAHGTGLAAQIPGVTVAGKSGTAQASKGKEHAWFVSYAPVEDPQVACAVVVEHGGHGGAVAAPIAHDLMALALGKMKEAQQGPEQVERQSD